jgi:hypothetical protein
LSYTAGQETGSPARTPDSPGLQIRDRSYGTLY